MNIRTVLTMGLLLAITRRNPFIRRQRVGLREAGVLR